MAALLNIVSLIALSASYDDALQFTSLTLSNVSLGTTLFSTQRGYDPVGMVVSVNTTLANGTDNQIFCYDSLNRLVWAGSTGTPNCSRTLAAGTLTAANYTATYAYDATNRITSGSLGTLTYGDSSHVHGATSSSSGETASYDTNGDMQCRAPTSATTCAGTPTGAHLDYDAERRLTHWQNAPTNPTTQAWYMYDGSGQRVEQYVSGGSGNHTYYLPGGVEEVTPSGSLIKYYAAGGMTLGLNTARDASGISYLASDGLGSVSEALSPGGSATGAQLYSPYGGMRYSSGTMPTNKGFTGQYSDVASSGLDYYGARYYDPNLGQFTSADTVADGLNRYGYVRGNPETATDPTGHRMNCKEDGDCSTPGKKPPECRSDGSCKCYTHCGDSKPKKKGWNGCYEDDVTCQGAKAQKDAQSGFDKLTNLLLDRYGKTFYDWVKSHGNFFDGLATWSLGKLLGWLRDGAAALWASYSGQLSTRAAIFAYWVAAFWEVHESASWFQNVYNVADFGRGVIQSVNEVVVIPAGISISWGVSFENPIPVLAGAGWISDGMSAFDILYDSVIDQVLEFYPMTDETAGGGTMYVK